ncbi:hypothetical protein [Bradyrhizobium japonicum]|uniref:hypothetical protein n=1 Tax=Bradyrhizobium japonicum TaxID=375 RepID=UPI001180F1A9|nr:hypothetical protein [Bradyrhizobium japonicum]
MIVVRLSAVFSLDIAEVRLALHERLRTRVPPTKRDVADQCALARCSVILPLPLYEHREPRAARLRGPGFRGFVGENAERAKHPVAAGINAEFNSWLAQWSQFSNGQTQKAARLVGLSRNAN